MVRAIDENARGRRRCRAHLHATRPRSRRSPAAGIATVDNVEQAPGQVALVFALLGADGDFGVKEDADSLLPDLLPERPDP